MEPFVFVDTEDNSIELRDSGRSTFEKEIVQIAARDSHGRRFFWEPKKGKKRKKTQGRLEDPGIAAFLKFCQEVSEEKVLVYAHNLRYDLGSMFAYCLDELAFVFVGSRLIRARWRNLEFRDTMNLFPMSLKRIGDAIGLSKLDLDLGSREYVDRDVDIGYEAVCIMRRFCEEFDIEYLPSTLGGIATKVWKSLNGGLIPIRPEFNDWYRKAYYGGRVELFSQGGEGNILYTDINSLYPSVMMQPFPLQMEQDKSGKLEGWGVARVRITIPECRIAPLPVEREDGSIYYPYGTIDGKDSALNGEGQPRNGVYTFHELRNAVEHGARIETIYEAWNSIGADYPYRSFVKLLYEKRKQCSDDDPFKLIYKLIMNNLYGQLAQSGTATTSVPLDKLIQKDSEGKPLYKEDGSPFLTKHGVVFGKLALVDTQFPLPEHVNIVHGAYVTSYARLALQGYLRSIPTDDLIYCDTDSVIFFNKGKNPPFKLSNELGEMKLEAKCKSCLTFGPKMYQTEDSKGEMKYKAKGVPHRYQQEFIERGYVAFDSPFNLRESIAFFDDLKKNGIHEKSRLASVWRRVEKHRRTNYDKKKFDKGIYSPLQHRNTI